MFPNLLSKGLELIPLLDVFLLVSLKSLVWMSELAPDGPHLSQTTGKGEGTSAGRKFMIVLPRLRKGHRAMVRLEWDLIIEAALCPQNPTARTVGTFETEIETGLSESLMIATRAPLSAHSTLKTSALMSRQRKSPSRFPISSIVPLALLILSPMVEMLVNSPTNLWLRPIPSNNLCLGFLRTWIVKLTLRPYDVNHILLLKTHPRRLILPIVLFPQTTRPLESYHKPMGFLLTGLLRISLTTKGIRLVLFLPQSSNSLVTM